MNIQHSSRTDQWGTPECVLAPVRAVLGRIDLDPASSTMWNKSVRADKFYASAGLAQEWHGSVFINPPGGKTRNQSNTVLFWEKLMWERAAGRISHAVFLAFSLEALATSQQVAPTMLDFPFCVPAKRVQFVSAGVEKRAPSHANVIVYVPGIVDCTPQFASAFATLGKVIT